MLTAHSDALNAIWSEMMSYAVIVKVGSSLKETFALCVVRGARNAQYPLTIVMEIAEHTISLCQEKESTTAYMMNTAQRVASTVLAVT